MRRAFVLLSLLAFASPALAETFTAGPGDDVESLINTLEPGDVLRLRAGDHRHAGLLHADVHCRRRPTHRRSA